MSFEFDGDKYSKASSHQKEWGERLIAELDLDGSERILDLGCGDGALSAHLAAMVPRGEVLGVDASTGMLDVAKRIERPNLRFELLDINALAFDGEFDVVFSNATLHWIKDHKRLLASVQRALRGGGRIRFNFAADGNCSHFFVVIREAMVQDEFAVHFAGFEWPWYMPAVDEYRALAESSGLRALKVWGENGDRRFTDEDAIIRWIDQPSLVPFLAHVSAPDRAAFRSFVVRRMIEETRQDDGSCFETFRRVNVSAAK